MNLELASGPVHEDWRVQAENLKANAETRLFVSYEEGDMTQPFSGFKQSGHAKDACFESLLAYMNSKAVWYRLD